MYCLIQFYVQLKDDLARHRPFLKVLCIKLVIFFCFWQSWIISLLTADGGPLKSSDKISGPDLRIGIPSMLTCVEMAIFAVLHLFAFPWKPYDLGRRHEQLPQGTDSFSADTPKAYAHGPARALLSALNPWDIIKACGRGFRWLFVGARHRKNDPSYQTKLEPMSNGDDTSYHGPTFAGNNEPAINTSSNKLGGRQGQAGKEGSDDSDTAALLSHAQTNPYVRLQEPPNPGAYHGRNAYDRPYNPDSLPAAPVPGQEYGIVGSATPQDGRRRISFETQETTYHGATPQRNEPQRTYDGDLGRPITEWDMFAGVTKPGVRPPGSGPPPGMI